MRDWSRVWALLVIVYITAIEATALGWTGRPALDAQTFANIAIVPLAQASVLAIIRSASSNFFVTWILLTSVLSVTVVAVGLLLFRSLPLTDAVLFTMLFVPAAQAGALLLRAIPGQLVERLRDVVAHPLARPVLWIDAMMLPAGWILSAHPLFGMSVAGVLQRRWMGTKLLAAAVCVLARAWRAESARASARDRAVFIVTGLVLAAIGAESFLPWIDASAANMPAPLSRQPLTFLRLEIYGALAILTIVTVRRTAAALRHQTAGAATVLDAGTIVFFVAVLALMMNGFLSLQPVKPWAGTAMTLGSVAATMFATALVAARRV